MAVVHFGRLAGAAGFARTVAIKRLHPHLAEDPDFLLTLVDEARMAARIQHPNVVAVLDVASTGGELLLVMEYVRGESLGRLLRAVRAADEVVPLPIVSAIVIGALRGLHAAHEAVDDTGAPLGIVHRDVSPQNILVGADGVARLIDFGIAKATGRLQTTREGVLKGKLGYMSPEQLSRVSQISRRADVYATGVVLWEAIAARPCFRTEGDAETYGLILAGAREPPSRHRAGLPRGLDEVVMKGMAVDPDRRFATALEMAEALQAVVRPAFPNEVGAWVEQTAHEALAARAAAVADIERSSASGPLPLPEGFAAAGQDDATTNVASQSSNLSIETPHRGRAGAYGFGTLRLSTWHAVGLAAVSVVVGGVAALMLRGPGSGAGERDPGAAAGAASVGAPASTTASSSSTDPSASASAAASTDAPDSAPAFSPRPHSHPHRWSAPAAPAAPPAPPAPSNDWPLSHERF